MISHQFSSPDVWGEFVRVVNETIPTKGGVGVPEKITFREPSYFMGRLTQFDPKSSPTMSENSYQPSYQIALPCAPISSTHLSIRVAKTTTSSYRYYVTDWSKNGTFINGNALRKDEIEVQNDDEISFRLKSEVILMYRFKANPEYVGESKSTNLNPGQSATSDDSRSKAAGDGHLEVQLSSLTPPALVPGPVDVSFFTQQINTLQSENATLELYLSDRANAIAALQSEISTLQKEQYTTQQLLQSKEQVNIELSQYMKEVESNATAAQARVRLLQEENDDNKFQTQDIKSKLAVAIDELQRKTQLLNSRSDVITELNDRLVAESTLRASMEARVDALNKEYAELTLKYDKLLTANMALHSMVNSLEQTIQDFKGKNASLASLLATLEESQQRAVEASHIMLANFSSRVSSLLQSIDGLVQEQTAQVKNNFETEIKTNCQLRFQYMIIPAEEEEDTMTGDLGTSLRGGYSDTLEASLTNNDIDIDTDTQLASSLCGSSFPNTGVIGDNPDSTPTPTLLFLPNLNQSRPLGSNGMHINSQTQTQDMAILLKSQTSMLLEETASANFEEASHAMDSCADDDQDSEPHNSVVGDSNMFGMEYGFGCTQVGMDIADNNDSNNDDSDDNSDDNIANGSSSGVDKKVDEVEEEKEKEIVVEAVTAENIDHLEDSSSSKSSAGMISDEAIQQDMELSNLPGIQAEINTYLVTAADDTVAAAAAADDDDDGYSSDATEDTPASTNALDSIANSNVIHDSDRICDDGVEGAKKRSLEQSGIIENNVNAAITSASSGSSGSSSSRSSRSSHVEPRDTAEEKKHKLSHENDIDNENDEEEEKEDDLNAIYGGKTSFLSDPCSFSAGDQIIFDL